MKLLIIEPFFSGSHKKWACDYQKYSNHTIEILSLPGRHWKWRMYGAAVSMADAFRQLEFSPDLIIASDMLDLATFMGLLRKELFGTPVTVYFHENQITYPWSPADAAFKSERNNQYGFINYTAALVADAVFFNSKYHLDSFTGQLKTFLKQFPDHQALQNVDRIKNKSQVLYLGMDLKAFDAFKDSSKNKVPVILWNHRWEYDKNPAAFYDALCFLKKEAIDFHLIVMGEAFQKTPAVFKKIKEKFQKELLHFGYAKDFKTYAQWLWKADLLLVTSHQDFFGGSVVEAIYCQNIPLLPDRLSYPEHIPNDLSKKYFYANGPEFQQQLKQSLLSFWSNTDKQQLSDFVARYDWSTLATHYDLRFQKVIDAHHSV